MLGLFCLGTFVPCANSRGAFLGTLSSLCSTIWLFVGSYTTTYSHTILYQKKSTLITGCLNLNKTRNQFLHLSNFATSSVSTSTSMSSVKLSDDVLRDDESSEFLVFLYSISYTWYGLIAVLVVLVVGTLTSLLTGNSYFIILTIFLKDRVIIFFVQSGPNKPSDGKYMVPIRENVIPKSFTASKFSKNLSFPKLWF